MRLRPKIISGFLILALMLFIAGAWTIYELKNMGSSVQAILDENYKSIMAAKTMNEALEREDSGILLLMLGHWSEGRNILEAADAQFEKGLETAAHNITIPDEQSYIDKIRSSYQEYRSVWEKPIVDTQKQGNLNWYFERAHESFLKVQSAVNELMFHNDQFMFDTAYHLQNKANRLVMPGVVAIISALIFSFLFSFFVNYYFISPIVNITESIKRFMERKEPFDVQIETNDEINDLADSINKLCLATDSRTGKQ